LIYSIWIVGFFFFILCTTESINSEFVNLEDKWLRRKSFVFLVLYLLNNCSFSSKFKWLRIS
ncbi:MAG: hypothetical protein K2H80_02075, partial [Ureaplasma sp.]|nr:hypothetical protein [Ureaplasma sp.]